APTIAVGAMPKRDPLASRVDLPPGFGGIEAAVAIRGPAGLSGLRTLHVGMTLVLAAALAVGVFFSLRAVRRELATARVRQNLLDNTSHELRTPLTTIRMHAEMLAEEALPDEKRDEYLRLVLAESERLSRLVDDVLDLSKLSRGEAPAATEPASPADLARAAVEAWSAGEVEVSVAEDLPLVSADRDSAIRVLLNLLENARKYAGGATAIEGRAGDGAVELIVADHGPGIPDGEREHLFTRFYRSPRDARRVKGVGLGLVLAREIARSQGGDVSLLESSAEGSRFALRLAAAKEEK
ncbi:MAG: HAMP domain-containing sensor histidine kinase, partial [Planctomycetota bacterium]